ncbi:hypothetical protein DM793_09590 [Paenarthrobacter nitroguajacolicus]|uniref:AAA family ATPase n=1 Tax=Paenarthrobacter nitroguajacolicus TaxID=211146 RepID=UPI0015BBB52D|nr:AAA family ATPase [Paenarthrobacter nitroguajacolicus]NWL11550.1 hypothetical protein [Paenarthrobacter nitroguajacolicus]
MAELILLNGPPGIGKSTLARMYADGHPGVLNLDVDKVRCMIGGWEEDFQAAGNLVRPIALSMATTHLTAGHTVIMPQYLDSGDEVLLFRSVAEEAGARFGEIVLMDSREASVERFYSRKDSHDLWHSRVTAIVERGGGSRLLESMYEDLAIGLNARSTATTITSRRGEIEETYESLVEALDLTAQ